MFEICLFDLDDTLIRTADLKQVREACKHNNDPQRLKALKALLVRGNGRHIYSLELLRQIRSDFPQLKLGVFTRSPQSYTSTVLSWAYPEFEWDIVVAYEDVQRTKPYGDGIDAAMNAFGVTHLDRVMLVGDSVVDVRSSYHCGCRVVLDRGAWPNKRSPEHWRALEHVPDAIIDVPEELLGVLKSPTCFLPELERLLAGGTSDSQAPRFDKINHFIARAAGEDAAPYPIYVAGRSFSNYESLQYRKQWHTLTASIVDNKESDRFPDEWVNAIRCFIEDQHFTFFDVSHIVVCVVPHRPGRKARLESLLKQLEQSLLEKPMKGFEIVCQAALLAYKPGVRSQHNDYLNRHERFINVRDHLFVQNTDLITAKGSFLVIDDVTTTGASLIYASKYLKMAGATDVKCLSMAKNIGDVL